MKQADIISNMTLEEKAAILSGASEWTTREIKRLEIPSIFCSDGPHGIRKQAGEGDHLGLNPSLEATCFPTAATVANSWNEELAEEIGIALGKEAVSLDVDIVLGPGLNIKRSSLCGRNFEYFSEDPYLSGKMAASYVRGIQSQGVYSCIKHFAVNSQELRRMAMNSVLDERTLREIYLTGFEIAIKEGKAKSIMTSYNQVNGTYANENEHLLKDILRKEWGFDGVVITDWGGSNDHVNGVKCRSNLEMPAPGFDSAREIIKAVENGTLTMEELDCCVNDLLTGIFELHNTKKNRENTIETINEEKHHQLAKKAARESIVLLKNVGGEKALLPLKEGCKVALIGDFAITPRYQGAGSSLVNPTKVESMKEMIGEYPITCIGSAVGYRRTGEEDEELKKEALDLARQADVVLYCFGLDEISESEGLDRTHMRIPQNQIGLLEALVQVNTNIVGVLSGGSAIEMPWHYCCPSLLHGYLSGQAGAGAMLDVLTGKVNPSGRLNETYPIRYEDTPAFRNFPSIERNSEYRESIFVGYRYYDTSRVRVQYPFGYGLSYTSFEYSDLSVDENKVTFSITNTGKVDGAEVAQVYVGAPKETIFRAEKELKGFKKVFLKAGETKKVTVAFDEFTFRYWNTKTNGWEVEEGNYTIYVGANVTDIRLTANIYKKGTTNEVPYNKEKMPHYFSGMIQEVLNVEFEELLGQKIPEGKWSGEFGVNDAICQMYYAKSRLARLVYHILTKMKIKSEEKGKPNLNILFIYNMPFRAIAKMTGGMVSMEMVNGIVMMVNGSFFKGFGKLIKEFFKNKRYNKNYQKHLQAFDGKKG